MVYLAGESPSVRSCTVYIFDSGQPYVPALRGLCLESLACILGDLVLVGAARHRNCDACLVCNYF